jgi:hypothetical protein
MMSAIPKKSTLLGAKSKLVGVVASQVGPAGATKRTEEGIGRFGVKKLRNRRNMSKNRSRKMIYKKHNGEKGLIPKF